MLRSHPRKMDRVKIDRYKASNLKTFNVLRYERYDSQFWVRFFTRRWDKAILNVLDEMLVDLKSLHILDVGCATGRLLNSLAHAGARSLAGTDLAPRILDIAAKKISQTDANVDLKLADAEQQLPWPDEFFDVVTMTGVLHHPYYPRRVLAEIRRVLVKNGRFILIEPWLPWFVRIPINIYLRVVPREGDCHYFSVTEAKRLLMQLDFEVLNYRRPTIHSFLFSTIKKKVSLS